MNCEPDSHDFHRIFESAAAQCDIALFVNREITSRRREATSWLLFRLRFAALAAVSPRCFAAVRPSLAALPLLLSPAHRVPGRCGQLFPRALAVFFSFSFFFGASLIPESFRRIFSRSSGVFPRPFSCNRKHLLDIASNFGPARHSQCLQSPSRTAGNPRAIGRHLFRYARIFESAAGIPRSPPANTPSIQRQLFQNLYASIGAFSFLAGQFFLRR